MFPPIQKNLVFLWKADPFFLRCRASPRLSASTRRKSGIQSGEPQILTRPFGRAVSQHPHLELENRPRLLLPPNRRPRLLFLFLPFLPLRRRPMPRRPVWFMSRKNHTRLLFYLRCPRRSARGTRRHLSRYPPVLHRHRSTLPATLKPSTPSFLDHQNFHCLRPYLNIHPQ